MNKSNIRLCLNLLFFIFVSILFIFKDFIQHSLFPIKASDDLSKYDIEIINNELLNSILHISNLTFNFNFFLSNALPFLFVIIGYTYIKLRDGFFRYGIGKNLDYSATLRTIKIKYAALAVITVMSIYIFLLLIGNFEGMLEINKNKFLASSYLFFISNTVWYYIIFFCIVKSLAVFVNMYIFLLFLDIFQSLMKGFLVYISLFWILSIMIYMFLGPFLAPMTTFMITSYWELNILNILTPYLIYIMIFVYINMRVKIEIN